jgi:hypothetical protein
MLTHRIRSGVFFLCLSLAASSTFAQSQPSADDKALASYRLTMATVQKVGRVNHAVVAEMLKDPKYQELKKIESEIDALEAKDDLSEAEQKRLEDLNARQESIENSLDGMENVMSDADTIDDMAARVRAYPPLAAALDREGLSAREYATFMLAMFQAGFAAGMQKAGLLKQLPANVNPENIKFVLEHEAELKQLQESFNPEGKG